MSELNSEELFLEDLRQLNELFKNISVGTRPQARRHRREEARRIMADLYENRRGDQEAMDVFI